MVCLFLHLAKEVEESRGNIVIWISVVFFSSSYIEHSNLIVHFKTVTQKLVAQLEISSNVYSSCNQEFAEACPIGPNLPTLADLNDFFAKRMAAILSRVGRLFAGCFGMFIFDMCNCYKVKNGIVK